MHYILITRNDCFRSFYVYAFVSDVILLWRCIRLYLSNEFEWLNISGHSGIIKPLAVSTACHWPCLIIGHRPMTKLICFFSRGMQVPSRCRKPGPKDI